MRIPRVSTVSLALFISPTGTCTVVTVLAATVKVVLQPNKGAFTVPLVLTSLLMKRSWCCGPS